MQASAWSYLLCTALLGACVTMEPSQGDSSDLQYQAAQVALFVLRSTADSGGGVTRYQLHPSRSPQTLEQISNSLASLEKPVQCAGRTRERVLTIVCQPLSDPDARAWLEREAREKLEWWWTSARNCQQTIDDARLLLRRHGDSLIVSFRALALWFKDYSVHSTLGTSRRLKRPLGVCLVLEVGPPGTIRIKPPPSGPVRS